MTEGSKAGDEERLDADRRLLRQIAELLKETVRLGSEIKQIDQKLDAVLRVIEGSRDSSR